MAVKNADKFLASVIRSGIDQPINRITDKAGKPLTEDNAWGWNDEREAFEGMFVSGREILDYSIEKNSKGGWSVEFEPSKRVKNNGVVDDADENETGK